MRNAIAMATLLAIALLVGTVASGANAATQPIGQDESTGPFNPGIPSD